MTWLLVCAQADGSDLEPPVPAGLNSPTPAQQSFITFFELDTDLLDAASATSPPLHNNSVALSSEWLETLSGKQKDILLQSVLEGAQGEVGKQYQARLRNRHNPISSETPRRTVEQLLHQADVLYEERRRRAEEEARRKRAQNKELALQRRKKHLAEIAATEDQIWAQVHARIADRSKESYRLAVGSLKDLYDVLSEQSREAEFHERLQIIKEEHKRKANFLDMLAIALPGR